jgi:hypothetical protein
VVPGHLKAGLNSFFEQLSHDFNVVRFKDLAQDALLFGGGRQLGV